MDLSNGGSFRELQQFQENLTVYNIVVFNGLNPDRVMFSGNSLSGRKFYLLYNAYTKHYSIINNIKAAMEKRYVCNAFDTLTTLRTNVTKLAPCVLLRHPVLKTKPSIMVHATGGFSERNVSRII